MATKKAIVKKTTSPKTTSSNTKTNQDKNKFTPFVWFFVFLLISLGLAALVNKAILAASINGQPINRLDILRELEKQGGQQALEALISKALITQAMDSNKMVVTDKQLDKRMKEIEKQLNQQGSDLDSLLVMQGMTKEEFVEQIKIRIFLESVLKKKILVTDQEVLDYIEQNQALMPEDLSQAEQNQLAKEQLENQKLSQETQKYLQELKDSAKIIYYVKY